MGVFQIPFFANSGGRQQTYQGRLRGALNGRRLVSREGGGPDIRWRLPATLYAHRGIGDRRRGLIAARPLELQINRR